MQVEEDVSTRDREFSLSLGGPLYQIYLRTRLAAPPLELVRRRIICLSAIFLLPPLVLSFLDGQLLKGSILPFLRDAEVLTRSLALILLIVAEVTEYRRMQLIVPEFVRRGIIAEEDRPRFDRLIASTMRLRNSIAAEVVLLLVAITAGHWVWKAHLTLPASTWYAIFAGGVTQPTPAGYWYAFISLPLLRFIFYRWYFRLFLWYIFLWRVRALPLHLNSFHPDRAAGLGFLEGSVFAFAPVQVAQAIFTAGIIANRIWYRGMTLTDFKMDTIGVTLSLMLLVLAPLFFFMPQLIRARQTAKLEFGALASRYVDAFRSKWIFGGTRRAEPLLGSSDIQSLADLANAYSTVRETRAVPFSKESLLRLAVMILLPLMPLLLTLIPVEQMIDRLSALLV